MWILLENSQRLDVWVSQILGVSREYAKQIVLDGKCVVDGKIEFKPGAKFSENAEISLNVGPPRYVSRGGYKIEKAIESFNLNVDNLYCMDVGASTGGFTDCLLKHGAAAVLAVDNGCGQLSPILAENSQIIALENTDIRTLNLDDLPFIPNLIAVDVSFISLIHIVPKVAELLSETGQAVLLIKPQFEVGPGRVSKGISKNPKDHIGVIANIAEMASNCGLQPMALDFSPIKGQSGNIEYLILLKKDTKCINLDKFLVEKIVQEVFATLR